MTLSVDHPLVLLLMPLALLPLVASVFVRQAYPSLALVPRDRLSDLVGLALRLLPAVAIAAIVLGLAGLHRREQTVERIGTGAHIVLLIDRSSSMDQTFAGHQPTGGEESKSAAARRLLEDFVRHRPHDLIAVDAFSTAPMVVLPLTDHHDAVLAAIRAIDQPGLAFTDVGRGLALAISAFDDATPDVARAILLVSDGAAVIDRRVQDFLRAAFARTRVHLYWLYLRTRGAHSINEAPGPATDDTPQALPERHLDRFFRALGIPYHAFEAENEQAVAQAIEEIDTLERRPLRFVERIPRRDHAGVAYAVAATALALLTAAKLGERRLVVRVDPSGRSVPVARSAV